MWMWKLYLPRYVGTWALGVQSIPFLLLATPSSVPLMGTKGWRADHSGEPFWRLFVYLSGTYAHVVDLEVPL